ncbi:MAG: MG2 domain-containing protein [Lentisphaeria bacterium]|nr:MG2 domain-containing protein [Lentisphaeria bacterium]
MPFAVEATSEQQEKKLKISQELDALAENGNWKELREEAQKQLDAISPDDDWAGVFWDHFCHGLRESDEIEQYDAMFEKYAAGKFAGNVAFFAHTPSWANMIPYIGSILGNAFKRGDPNWENTGREVESRYRDRARLLSLMVPLIPKAQEQRNRTRCQHFFCVLAQVLLKYHDRGHSYKLQELTDLDNLPDYNDEEEFYASSSRPPVNPDGSPVFYRLPESWDKAANDGERLRFAIEQANCDDAKRLWADFLCEQFDFLKMDPDHRQKYYMTPAMIQSLYDLKDNESMAALADNVRRITLPDEFNYMEMYRNLNDHLKLGELPPSRMQFDQAASEFQTAPDSISKPPADHIRRSWGEPESSYITLPGKDFTVPYHFRNAKTVTVKLYRVDMAKTVERWLDNLKNAESEHFSPCDFALIRNKENDDEIWKDLIAKEPFIIKRFDLEPLPHHWEKTTQLHFGNLEPGAFVAEFVPDDNQESRMDSMIWIADRALTTMTCSGNDRIRLFVNDPVTGGPCSDVTIKIHSFYRMYGAESGRPQIISEVLTYETDANGIVEFPPTDFKKPKDSRLTARVILAETSPEKLTMLKCDDFRYGRASNAVPDENMRKFIITDKTVYKPGDTIAFTGYLRQPLDSENFKPYPKETITLFFMDPQYHEAFQKEVPFDEKTQSFTFEMKLPADVMLGWWQVFADKDVSAAADFLFLVAEYKKPEYLLTVTPPAKPVKAGEKMPVTIEAKYYFGAPMPDAEVSYKVFREEAQPVMPFAFEWNWAYFDPYALCTTFLKKEYVQNINHDKEMILNAKGRTDAQGELTFEIDSALAVEKFGEKDFRYTIKAEIMDDTNRLVSGSGSVIAAVKPFRVFLYTPWGFAKTGERQQIQVAARTPNGEKINGMGTLRIFRKAIGNAPKDGRTTSGLPERVGAALKTIHFTPDGPDNPEFILNEEGVYEVEAEVISEDGVSASQSMTFFVVGEKQGESLFGEYPISISTDKPTYQPGETAQILVACDKPGRTIYFVTRSERDARIQCVTLSGHAKLFPVPIEKDDQPSFFVNVMSYQDGQLATLTQEIRVPPEKKILQVNAEPAVEKVEPGSMLPLTITVADLEGKPVSGHATVTVYDKSLEAINDTCTLSPILPFFWPWKRWFFHSLDGFFKRMPRMWKPLSQLRRSFYHQFLFGFHNQGMSRDASEDSDEVEAPMPMPTMVPMDASYAMSSDDSYGIASEEAEEEFVLGAYAGEEAGAANTVRKNFLDRAFWAGRLDLPESGEITVNIPVPDNLTTWVVRVWSLTPDNRVGEARTEIVVSKDLVARLELPRFMFQGDTVNTVVSLNNSTSDELGEVSTSLAAPGLLETAHTQTVTLQANGAASYEVPLQAKEAGEYILTLSTKAADKSDALELALPVLSKGLDKQVNTCGRLDATRTTASITLDIPEERRPETTAFALYLSPGAAKNMIDVLPYLAADDSGDVFGIVNHFLPALSAKTALNKLGVKWEDAVPEKSSRDSLYAEYSQRTSGVPSFSAEDFDRIVAKNLRQIARMVNPDSGWGWFGAYHESSWPDTTAYVVDALLDVRDQFDARLIDDGVFWLEDYAKKRIAKFKEVQAVSNTDAFVARVLSKAGRPNTELMKLCYDNRVKCLAPYGYAMLALAYAKDTDEAKMLTRNLEQFLKIDDENGTAYLSIPRQCSFFWYGDENETLAAYLELLLRDDPQNDTAQKVANYLAANVRNSPWRNSTRSLGAAVKALAKYIVASGEDKPDFTLTVRDGGMEQKYVFNVQNLWKNDGPAFFLPSDKLASGKRTIELEFSGTGALYWNGMLSYFTLEDEIKPAGLEMKIQRNYYRLVEDPNASALLAGKNGAAVKADTLKYKRIPLADGDSVKPGDLVEVELISTSKNDYDYVVLQDAMPAGFEYENPISGWKWDWAAPMFVEYKERGAKFYLRNMARGQSNAFYRIRAQLCGTVTALPAKGYGIYAPELKCNGEQQTLNTKK